jgi:hypothetical protein
VGTGIVFVVLVAIWVAYFVQYWSRRREHLATARSVEDFAEAMRVLERRPALRAASPGRVSSAYAMSPARVVSERPPSRPQVIAKPHPTMPPPSRRGASRMPTPTSPRRPPRPAARTAAHRRTADGRRPMSPSRMSPSRRVRGLTLLGALLATLVTAVLAPLTTLLWWVPLIGVAAVVGSLLWVRAGVRAEIEARGAARATARRRPRRPASSSGPRAAAHRDVRDKAPDTGPVRLSGPELHETSEVTATRTAGRDGWQPVPVPPPTYTLKARAERPEPAQPAEVGEVGEVAEPARAQVDPPMVAAEAGTDSADGHAERRSAYGT